MRPVSQLSTLMRPAARLSAAPNAFEGIRFGGGDTGYAFRCDASRRYAQLRSPLPMAAKPLDY
jgi:hypothetical protein